MTKAEGRKLGWRIKEALKADRIERARQFGQQLMVHLEDCRAREARGTLWGWYKLVEPKAAKPCFQRREDQTKEWEALYGKVKPPGDRIQRNVERVSSDNETVLNEELRWATKRGGNIKSGGNSCMRVEDLKDWLASAEREEAAEKKEEEGHEGRVGHVARVIWETSVELDCWR